MKSRQILNYIIQLKNKPRKFWLIWALVAIFLFALTHFFHSKTPQIDLAPVEVFKTSAGEIANIASFSGKTEAYNTVNVAAQVTGQITAINFSQGRFVKEGEVLFVVDSRKYDAHLKIAEAQLAQDTVQLELQEKDLARYKTLNAQKYISDEQLDKAISNRSSLIAAIEADKANISNAKLMLEYCSIKAPVSGIVGQINVNVGNIIQADGKTPITTIMQISPIYIAFQVDSKTLDKLRKIADLALLPIVIYTESGEEIKEAKLSFIDNSINPNSGSTDVKAIYENKQQNLWANQFVKVAVTMNVRHEAVTVPRSALLQNQLGYFVFTVDQSNIAHIRQVSIGVQNDKIVEITSGLKQGESVVTDGQLRLNEGTHVKIVNQEVLQP